MEHNHANDNASKNIVVAFFLNLVFTVIELVGGLLTNSIAILSDALHDFGDCLSLGVAWVLQRKSQQGRDARYSYGYKRFSLLGSVFLSGVLFVSSIFVIIEAAKRLSSPAAVSAQGMFWLAIVGVVINGAAALRLVRGHSLNERAVFLHIMEDVLGWVAVLVVSVVMLFVNLPILDPILSLAITAWVLFNVYRNTRDTFKVFLQAVPEGVDVDALTARIQGLDGVDSLHDMHVWTLDGESHVMTVHIVSSAERCGLKEQIRNIAAEYHIAHVTIEFDAVGDECCYVHDKD